MSPSDFWKLRPWELHWIIDAHAPIERDEADDWRLVAAQNLEKAKVAEAEADGSLVVRSRLSLAELRRINAEKAQAKAALDGGSKA